MKILQVIPYFAPAWSFGGPVKVCYQLSKSLVNIGHNVSIWTTDASNLNEPIRKYEEILEGMNIKRFRNLFPNLTHSHNIFSPLKFSTYAKKNISSFDIVHCHSFFTFQNIVIEKVCRTKKIPYIIHLHESPVPNHTLGKKHIKTIFNYLFGKKILNNASKIIVVTPKEKETLIQYMPQVVKKINVVPNPFEDQLSYTIKKKSLTDTKVILFLGRISPIKAIDKLINAFNELLKIDDTYRLIIAGPNEGGTICSIKNQINKLGIKNKIEFTGLVTGKQKEQVFNRSDIFAIFSDYESFSLATIEALQHNLPCCISNNVGIAPYIDKYNCGVTIQDTNNPFDCAKALSETFNKREELSINCQKILPMFKLSTITNSIINIYKEIKK